MNYLKKYNLTAEEISYLENNLSTNDYQEFILKEDKITKIIDYLISIGLSNIKEIILYKPNLFYDSLSTIIKSFTESSNPDLITLINEDANNLDLIGY